MEVLTILQKNISKGSERKSKISCVSGFGQTTDGAYNSKMFRCRSKNHLIERFPITLKDNKKQQKQVSSSERGNSALQEEYNNHDNDNDQKIYASMAHMYDNEKIPSRDFGDSSKLTNWILDSGSMCHMTTQVSGFIPVALEDTDKNIGVGDGHHVW